MESRFQVRKMKTDGRSNSISGKKKALFALALPFLVFLILEFTARAIESNHPPLPVDLGLGFDPESRLFIPENSTGFLITNPDKSKSFQTSRFQNPKLPGTLRIAIFGGSSVYNIQQELKSLKTRLEEKLPDCYERVELINAGGNSYGSHRIVALVNEILEYEPDLVLIYSGHNEFEEQVQMQWSLGSLVGPMNRLSQLAFFRVPRDWWVKRRLQSLTPEEKWSYWSSVNKNILHGAPHTARRQDQSAFTPEEIEKRILAFESNLRLMLQACRRKQVPVVLGTVSSNLVAPFIGSENQQKQLQKIVGLLGRREYAQAKALSKKILADSSTRHQASDLENKAIRSLAQEFGIPLADVEGRIEAAEPHQIPGETLFADHCHLNSNGNAILIREFEEQILHVVSDCRTMNK
jgi:hypothetical protein